ncbi:hypothetical protein PMAYCL1PPCAC_05166, partial [Pristionchus mayeri]
LIHTLVPPAAISHYIMNNLSNFHRALHIPPFYIPGVFHDRGWTLDMNIQAAGSLGILRKFDSADGSDSIMIKKYINHSESLDRKTLIRRELNLLRTLQHEHIVRLLGTYYVDEEPGKEAIYSITVYCGVPLEKKILEGIYSMKDVISWTRQLLQAIHHLHINKVLFRNLHPRNMCIDANNKLTLTGFGKARVVNHDPNLTKERGTEPYMSIEQLVDWNGAYDNTVDIWCITTILCEMITGQGLFTGEKVKSSLKRQIEYCGPVDQAVLEKMTSPTDRTQLATYSKKCERKDFIAILREKLMSGRAIVEADILEYEEPLRDFIENTLQFNASLRMSAEEALRHRFVYNTPAFTQANNVANNMQQLRALINQQLAASSNVMQFL